ncbi:hypothetical protein GIB67_009980 [Kingdonia uniflora]|uniref:Uncharacterized protein n=1 Tax=Kingdonia uniflora TaxID=39325 RepID=A0A7J7L919_9MAGN|nr:hypothetical protein GIB67_009980 [Kingdonia uniflora]
MGSYLKQPKLGRSMRQSEGEFGLGTAVAEFNYDSTLEDIEIEVNVISPQSNNLGSGSAQEALGAQQTEGDLMNEGNIEAPPTEFAIEFRIPPGEIYLPWAGSTFQTDGKQFAAYTTFFESWIFAHFPKLPGIPKKQHSDTVEYCIRRVPNNAMVGGECDLLMYVSGEPSNVVQHEQYLLLRDENKLLVEHILGLSEEVQKLKEQKKQENEATSRITEKLSENLRECEQLRVTIEEIKEDKILNHVVHEQFIKSFEELPVKLEENIKGCQALNEQSVKLVEDLKIRAGVDDCNPSLSWEFANKTKQCELLEDINAKLTEQLNWQLLPPIPEVWRQTMKIEFKSGELADKDNLTFIKLFDQYDKFYTIAQQGPNGDYRDDFTLTGGTRDKVMEVRRANVLVKKKIDKTLFKLYVKFYLDVRGVQGEDENSAFRVPQQLSIKVKTNLKKK